MSIPDLSISIVNTSNWKFLKPCINSIYKSTKSISYEILVVDNASTDGSLEKIKKFFPEIILSINNKKYGFAKNNNINIKKSTGRYIMLLNDDTIVLDQSLEKAIAYLDNNPKVGMLGCKMINPDGTIQYTSGRQFDTLLSTFFLETGLINRFSIFKYFSTSIIEKNGYNSICEIDLPQESGMIIKNEIIKEVGLLDEDFFMFGEGPDWCRRIKKTGLDIIYFPESPIIHFGGETNKKMSINMYLQHYKSLYIYFKKVNLLSGLLYRFMIFSIYLCKYLVKMLVIILRSGDRTRNIELLRDYKALLKLLIFRLNDDYYPFPTYKEIIE